MVRDFGWVDRLRVDVLCCDVMFGSMWWCLFVFMRAYHNSLLNLPNENSFYPCSIGIWCFQFLLDFSLAPHTTSSMLGSTYCLSFVKSLYRLNEFSQNRFTLILDYSSQARHTGKQCDNVNRFFGWIGKEEKIPQENVFVDDYNWHANSNHFIDNFNPTRMAILADDFIFITG